MKVQPRIEKLQTLVDYLDGLTERASIESLDSHLRALDIDVSDLAEFARFSNTQYQRNLVSEGSWYHLLVICWKSGQRSPIHNHAESTCGFRVLQGKATETTFEMTPCTMVKAMSSTDMDVGSVAAMKDDDIHQMSNLQAEGTDLVTLHIYSPPLLRMQTYSLTERKVGEYRPQIHEHSFGSGI